VKETKLSRFARSASVTIDKYNSDIDSVGYDTVFGRKFQFGLERPLVKIDTPPFYAIRCKVSLSSLKGGVTINTKAQVIDNFGDPIPGLYAAGEVAGGFCSIPDAYYAGIMTLPAFVF